jgi:hypothetical protein
MAFSKDSMRVITKDFKNPDSKDSQELDVMKNTVNIWGYKANNVKSPFCLERMSKRILEIRNENHKVI